MKKYLLAATISICTAAPAFAWFGGDLYLDEYFYNLTSKSWYIYRSTERGVYSTFEACLAAGTKGDQALLAAGKLWTGPNMSPSNFTPTKAPFAYTCVPFIPND